MGPPLTAASILDKLELIGFLQCRVVPEKGCMNALRMFKRQIIILHTGRKPAKVDHEQEISSSCRIPTSATEARSIEARSGSSARL